MAVFAVIASVNPSVVKNAIATQYGANHFEFTQSVWFVADSGTTANVMDKLGIRNGKLGAQAAVLKISAFAGYASKTLWSWLDEHPEAISNG